MKNWRNRKVAVALGNQRDGQARIAVEEAKLRDHLEGRQGCETSTGSIRVRKMVQNAAARNGNRK